MKSSNLRRIPIVFLSLVLAISLSVFATDSKYGTADDPLISLSYVNEVLKPQLIAEVRAQMQSEIDKAVADALENAIDKSNEELLNKISDMEAIIEALKAENTEQSGRLDAINERVDAMEKALDELLGEYGMIFLKKGDKIVSNGITQLIIASGGAESGGDSLENAREYLFVSAGEAITAQKDSYVLLRGNYKLFA